MLELLSIKNVALIKDLTIEFGKGFNVLMGETGAGKSIIFDSLNFVLGAKVDKSLLRTGESQMKVDAVFSSLNTQTKDFLIDHGLLEEDEECQQLLLSRVFNADGKSTIRINGQLSTSSILKSLGESLVDSYSQHENVTLLKSKNHLAMLDKFGGEKLLEIKNKLFDSYQVLNDLKKKIDALGGDTFERERTKSLLEYQIREIEDAELKSGEDEELKEKLHLMNSAEKINEGISASERLLEENTSSVLDSLQEVESILSSLNTFSKIEERTANNYNKNYNEASKLIFENVYHNDELISINEIIEKATSIEQIQQLKNLLNEQLKSLTNEQSEFRQMKNNDNKKRYYKI